MRMVGKTGIGIAGGLVLAGALAFAQDAGRRPLLPGGGAGHGRCGEKLVQSLGLSADQQAALETLRNETAEATRPLAEQLHALHGQIETAADGASPDACAIGGLVIQGKAIRSQMDEARKAAEAKFVAGLSADQKSKYESYVSINPECTAVGSGFMRPFPMEPPRAQQF
jgi:hypothetical protein